MVPYIVAAALHVKIGTSEKLHRAALPTIHTENNCIKVSVLYWQLVIEDKCMWSMIRLGTTYNAASLGMHRNHTRFCKALHVVQIHTFNNHEFAYSIQHSCHVLG